MTETILTWEISGILIIFFLGAILHEAYKLSGHNTFADMVNNFLLAKTSSLYIVPILIALLHYSYKIILGKHLFVIDLLVFLIAISAGQLVSYSLLTNPQHFTVLNWVALLALFFALGVFIYYTFNPPKIAVFRDGNTGEYGIRRIS